MFMTYSTNQRQGRGRRKSHTALGKGEDTEQLRTMEVDMSKYAFSY